MRARRPVPLRAVFKPERLSGGRWFKKVGEAVTRDEPLVEIDTGNVTHEVCASVTGVLSEIFVKDGQFTQRQAVLGTISTF